MSAPDLAARPAVATEVDYGLPGASLQRQYERLSKKREDRVRARYPRVGRVILAITKEPPSTRAFKIGAEGERRVAAALTKRCGDDVVFLHNRKLGRTRRDGDIDLVAIAGNGIYALDAKLYAGAKVEVRRSGGLLTQRVEKLYVRGSNKTAMVGGIGKQVEAITTALADFRGLPGIPTREVPVRGALVFIEAQLPLLFHESIGGVPLLGPRSAAKLLRAKGPYGPAERAALAHHLAAALPPAD